MLCLPHALISSRQSLCFICSYLDLQPDAAKRELLRQIYDKYDGWVKVGGPNSISVSAVSFSGNPLCADVLFRMLYFARGASLSLNELAHYSLGAFDESTVPLQSPFATIIL